MPVIKMKGVIHDTLTGYNFTQDAPLHRAKAIRAKCRECTGDQERIIRHCHIVDCPLWPWRMGRPLREDEKRLHLESYDPDGSDRSK